MTTDSYPTDTGTHLDPPALDRPMFHVWIGEGPDDPAPDYVGVVTVTNADQLMAETQAKAVGIRDPKSSPFHLTNLWLWCAMVRREMTSDKFKPFTARVEYRPVTEQEDAQGEGPTDGAQGPNTD